MFTRRCLTPDRSFFLFGPRGTGKSTWIRSAIRADVSYDLLDAAESIRMAADPGLLARETAHVPAGGWVAIDEIQKVPGLLDEVHRLIELRRLRFVLSGSSARKVRRGAQTCLPAWKLKRATKQVAHPKFYLFDSGVARARRDSVLPGFIQALSVSDGILCCRSPGLRRGLVWGRERRDSLLRGFIQALSVSDGILYCRSPGLRRGLVWGRARRDSLLPIPRLTPRACMGTCATGFFAADPPAYAEGLYGDVSDGILCCRASYEP